MEEIILQRISELHRAYDSLQYPPLFPYAEDDSTISTPQVDLLLVFIANPLRLWKLFKRQFYDDIFHRIRCMLVHFPGTPLLEEIENKCLILIEDIALEMAGATLPVYGLPAPRRDSNYLGNSELLREMDTTITNICCAM